jgi:hypothetical protein
LSAVGQPQRDERHLGANALSRVAQQPLDVGRFDAAFDELASPIVFDECLDQRSALFFAASQVEADAGRIFDGGSLPEFVGGLRPTLGVFGCLALLEQAPSDADFGGGRLGG